MKDPFSSSATFADRMSQLQQKLDALHELDRREQADLGERQLERRTEAISNMIRGW